MRRGLGRLRVYSEGLMCPSVSIKQAGVNVAAHVVEGVTVGVGGAAVGWLFGGLVQPALGVVVAIVAGVNGAISGWRHVYAWRTGRGLMAFLLDSTWATIPVAAGLLAHLAALVSNGRGGLDHSLSARQNRHVYRGGAHLQTGFALTVGNVISSAGDVSRARRRKLITDHEAVHIWQARWFGPLYLVLYLGWTGFGALVGVLLWLRRGRTAPLGQMVESCSYYLNPFEWWAYSRDNLWPPPGLAAGVGWRKPVVRPFADAHAHRH